jgi:hypothetical protein
MGALVPYSLFSTFVVCSTLQLPLFEIPGVIFFPHKTVLQVGWVSKAGPKHKDWREMGKQIRRQTSGSRGPCFGM